MTRRIALSVALLSVGLMGFGAAAWLAVHRKPAALAEAVASPAGFQGILNGFTQTSSAALAPVSEARPREDIVVNRLITGDLVGACGGNRFCQTGPVTD